MRIASRFAFFAGFALAVALTAAAQQPILTNARLETRAAGASLETEFRALVASQVSPVWVGYGVPMIAGDRQACCYTSVDAASGHCGRCALERDKEGINIRSGGSSAEKPTPVRLEGPRFLWVLYRIEQKRVEQIRTYSEDCELDAGGLPFIWLSGVGPADSVALLASFATSASPEGREEERIGNRAIPAIALTADPATDRALETFVAADQPESLREHAAFWLGAARGHAGYELLKRMASGDPSEQVREKVAFVLSVSREPEAMDEMIRMAKQDASAGVRGQALFWLAQKASKKAVGTIAEAIENDPDTQVKRRAVFALSQLPTEEGVPLLIQVARTNRNPAVRKQAFFWLGQSHDPRALAFFEEVLAR